MKYEFCAASQLKFPADALLIFSHSGEKSAYKNLFSKNQLKCIEQRLAEEGFKGEKHQVARISCEGVSQRVIVGGLGPRAEFNTETLRKTVSRQIDYILQTKIGGFAVALPDALRDGESLHALIEAIELSSYAFTKYKTKPNENGGRDTKLVRIACLDRPANRDARGAGGLPKTADIALTHARSTNLVRDLVTEPPSKLTPEALANAARDIARKNGLEIKVYDEKQIEKMGMFSFRGVSLGSDKPPRFVHMTYKPRRSVKTVCLVGKGITYDSGGLCLKSPANMDGMKMDMAGAATVIGAIKAASELKLNVTVHSIFAATENMPGPGAYKLGDVLKAMNGKTIEVLNTDAEGRLVLADALAYACKLKPDYIIDLATLTGACVVALGHSIAGLFATDDWLADSLIEAGKKEGEKLWRLPLEEDYVEEHLKSEVADIKNVGAGGGGAVIAALFLKQFIEPSVKWAHLDIAGPGMGDKKRFYVPKGGTGAMTRTVVRFLEDLSG